MRADTPMKAIRAKCLDCVNGQIYEINKCHIEKCPLWKYRTGHNPNRKGKGPKRPFQTKNTENEQIIEEDISE